MTIKEDEEIVVEGNASHRTTNALRFPEPFNDEATSKLMKDPVLDAEGDSHEKSSLPAQSGRAAYYPNRALQDIIQSEVALASNTWQGSVRRLDRALQSGWGRLVEQSAFGVGEYRPLPESFYCPITCELITDPVVTKEGITYERGAIENWIRVNGKSPMTRNPLTLADLRPNNAIYELIQLEKGRTLDSVHPSIRRWKESGAETFRPEPSAPAGEPDIPIVSGMPVGSTTPNGVDSATTPSPPANIQYPTTAAEIEERRRQRRRKNQTIWIVICCTLVVMFLFFPYAFGMLLFFAMLACPFVCCCYLCAARSEEDEN